MNRVWGTLLKERETDWTFPTWAEVVNEGACRAGAARGRGAGPARYEACERPARQPTKTTMATCWYMLT